MHYLNSMRNWRVTAALVLGAVVAAGCNTDDRSGAGPSEVPAPAPDAGLDLTLAVSRTDAPVGSRITVAIKADAEITALQGTLRFDPAKLRYVGQGGQELATLAMVREQDARSGLLAMLATNPQAGLKGPISPMVFEVLASGYAASLKYTMAVAARGELELRGARVASGVIVDAQMTPSAEASKLGVEEWAAILDPSGGWRRDVVLAGSRPSLSPGQRGQGAVTSVNYGDVNLSGTFSSLDVATAGNAALGRAGSEIIVGTDSATGNNRDLVIAANVRPATAPIGGADPNKVLNALDVQALQATFLTPTDTDVLGVVNTPIREATNAGCTNLVVPAGTLTGNITWDVARPCWVQLDGIVRIGGNDGTVPGDSATLTITKNTIVKGNSAINPSALFIQRQGRIIAIGTDAEPIEFTCTAALAPGCWGGVFIAGNASLNEAAATNGSSPAIAGRQGGGGNQRLGEGGAPNYGGNNDADSSGVMRYVRIEGAGFLLSTNNELNCLTFGAVGYGSDFDHIECKRGSDDSFEWFGGTADASYLVSIDNQDDGIDGSFGWNGRVQYAIVRQQADGDKGFEFDNTETAATYGNTPTTTAEIYNVTVIGGPTSAPATEALHLRRGTSIEVGNLLVIDHANVLDLDDAASSTRARCGTGTIFSLAQESDSLVVWRSRFNAGFTGNADTEGAFCGLPATTDNESAWLGLPALLNSGSVATAGSLLISPASASNPDYRPIPGQLAVPAADAALGMPGARTGHINFVATGASHYGALPTTAATQNNLPWYAGWTRF